MYCGVKGAALFGMVALWLALVALGTEHQARTAEMLERKAETVESLRQDIRLLRQDLHNRARRLSEYEMHRSRVEAFNPRAESYKIAVAVHDAAKATGLSARFLQDVIEQESGFRGKVMSEAKARGPMQIKHSFWGEFCDVTKAELYDEYKGVMCGAQIIAHLVERFGNLKDAMCYYTSGQKGCAFYVALITRGES